jgi:hypothetical protein
MKPPDFKSGLKVHLPPLRPITPPKPLLESSNLEVLSVCYELTDKAAPGLGTGRSVISGQGDAGSTPAQTINPTIKTSMDPSKPME